MLVTREFVQWPNVCALVAKPAGPPGRRWPAVVAWSDIFQLTPPHVRIVTRLASHGFLVVAPELYGRFEPPGTVFDFDADRSRALEASAKTRLEWIDEDTRAVLDAVAARDDVGDLAALGWCFGGHVAFRAAFDGRVKAAACCYPTGVHDGKLGDRDGKSTRAGSIERAGEISGELLLVWGREDPHIPADGRAALHAALERASVKFEARLFDAQHTFMRDEGARYDAEAADRAFVAIVDLLRRTLAPLR
ncbi:MAG: dienelactone hydrolase family protein [Polyangiaceae bacterium]